MYRAVALWAMRQKADTSDMHRMEQLARAADIELEPAGPSIAITTRRDCLATIACPKPLG